MYTRSYPAEEERIKIPENYDGTMLREEPKETYIPSEPISSTEEKTEEVYKATPLWEPGIPSEREKEEERSIPTVGKAKPSGGFLDGMLKFLPSFNLFGKQKDGGLQFSLGTEELLIIGVALFLFLTKGGDKECALMLLFLLFIN